MSLLRADAVALPLADNTVDLIVTSPPYFALRSYTDGGEHYDGQIGSEATPQAFLEALWAVTAECRRVLKPSGSMFVNLGDKYAGDKSLMGLPWRYAIGCIDDLDLILRAEIVWSKPNGLPESVTDRVRRSHEQWFHMVKSPRYYSAVDEVREAHADSSHHRVESSTTAADRTRIPGLGVRWGAKEVSLNPLGKLPGSVWTVPSEPLKVPDWLGVDHFAAFPQEWPRRLILGWSPPGICVECGEGRRPVVEKEPEKPGIERGKHKSAHRTTVPQRSASGGLGLRLATITGYACACPTPDAPTRPAVVLDPFGGTGTTAMVARALGRYPVHVDLSADYLKLARWRIYESGHASKTIERTNKDRQQSMFDVA